MTSQLFDFRPPVPPSQSSVRRVLVVHANSDFSATLNSALVQAELTTRCVRNRGEALAVFNELSPDVTLLDLALPDCDGIELIRELLRSRPNMPVVVLTAESDENRILSAIRAGATGYVFESDVRSRVVQLVEEIMHGGAPLSRPVAHLLLRACRGTETRPQDQPDLTPRERTVLGMLAEGKSYAEVGSTLGVSENTVRSHVRSIYDKLGASSKTEAVMAALRLGLLRVG